MSRSTPEHQAALGQLDRAQPTAPAATRWTVATILAWPDSSYRLERAAAVDGPWSEVTGAMSPHVSDAHETQAFYRLRQP